MKLKKRIFSVVLALVLMLTMSASAFAGTTNKTITIKNPSVDQTYKAYKILDAQVDGSKTSNVTYTIQSDSTNANPWLSVIQNATSGGKNLFTLKASSTAGTVTTYQVTKNGTDAEVKTWLEGLKVPSGATEAVSEKATGITLALTVEETGYYLVTKVDTSGAQTGIATVDTVNENITIEDKNPTEPGQYGQNEYKSGTGTAELMNDTASFTVQFQATNFVTKERTSTRIQSYTIKEKPSNVTLDWTSLSITIGDTKVTGANGTILDAYKNVVKVAASEEIGVDKEIQLTWATKSGDEWTSLYQSPVAVVVTIDGNTTGLGSTSTNSVELLYTPVDGTATRIDDPENPPTVSVKNYMATITKVDSNDQSKTLAGAEFELYGPSDVAAMTFTGSNGVYTVAKDGSTGPDYTTTLVTADDGTLVIKGLCGNTTYSLKETQAPAGYVAQEEAYQLTITDEDITYKATNVAGTELPATGGMGTTLFYVIGAIMVIGAAVTFYVRRRDA